MQNFTLTYSKGSKPKDINVKAAKSFIKRDKPPTLRPRKTQQYRPRCMRKQRDEAKPKSVPSAALNSYRRLT